MKATVYDTNDCSLESWVESANDPASEFPIQNLPFGRFRLTEMLEWRLGVAIGDKVLDLRSAGLIDHSDMRLILGLCDTDRRRLRHEISLSLRKGSHKQNVVVQSLFKIEDVQLGLPCDIKNYSDFYIGIHHATAVGRLFRPDNPLLPNYDWVPIGYHGRASTIEASGTSFHRPLGQVKHPGLDVPSLVPSGRLDIELEVGAVIGRGNKQGERILIDDAEGHIFGLTLLNDWSARDFQSWEYQPLGPFLSKSFTTTLSSWIVTLDALEPFRLPFLRHLGRPAPLPYLTSLANSEIGSFDISFSVVLQTSKMAGDSYAGDVISNTRFDDAAYWTIAQLVTHHTVNGCRLECGDLLGSGTLSGSHPNNAGSLLEKTNSGHKTIQLSNGEERTFIEDGDTVILKAWCEKEGYRRIGFGECRATVLPVAL